MDNSIYLYITIPHHYLPSEPKVRSRRWRLKRGKRRINIRPGCVYNLLYLDLRYVFYIFSLEGFDPLLVHFACTSDLLRLVPQPLE